MSHPQGKKGSRVVEGHVARKRFGQNFLSDDRIIQQIVASFQPNSAQNVVEIGPGLGALTKVLLPALGRLQVVELDRDLAARLPDTLAQYTLALSADGLQLIHTYDSQGAEADITTLLDDSRDTCMSSCG